MSQKTDQMVESGIILQWEAEPLDCGGVGGGGGGGRGGVCVMGDGGKSRRGVEAKILIRMI